MLCRLRKLIFKDDLDDIENELKELESMFSK